MSAIVPIPKCPITIREASMDDLKFIDDLQKLHRNQVGFLRENALVAKIAAKQVIIAEEVIGHSSLVIGQEQEPMTNDKGQVTRPVGYCIGQDRYFKRDDVGIIYQMNVCLRSSGVYRRDACEGDVRSRGVWVSIVLSAGARRISTRITSGSRSGLCHSRFARGVAEEVARAYLLAEADS
jgi:hypothetical protein